MWEREGEEGEREDVFVVVVVVVGVRSPAMCKWMLGFPLMYVLGEMVTNCRMRHSCRINVKDRG